MEEQPEGMEAVVTLQGDPLLSQRPQIECNVVENARAPGAG